MGKYREKECGFCKIKHRKKGPYCSQACANRARPEYSPKVSENMRRVATEYNKTPEAIAQQRLFHTGIAPDDWGVEIPTLDPDLSDYTDYERGENW